MTTAASTAQNLLDRLKTSGFSAVEIGLRGYFHHEGHSNELGALIDFCDSNPEFQFRECSKLSTPTRSTVTGDYVRAGPLHHSVLSSILVERSDWRKAFTRLLDSVTDNGESNLTCIGPEPFVPVFVTSSRWVKLRQLEGLSEPPPPTEPWPCELDLAGDYIAVTGMACQLPAAADLNEFWSLLRSGTSQHTPVPASRFGGVSTPWRDANARREFYGNFLADDDASSFDEKFFGKTPRESASTDPQHRLMLQVAYQALEQAGYFRCPEKSVGCYLGVGLDDYENNVACHPPTAYTAIGNLRAFAAGRISHYFGWTGPGLTIDTACSSSAVAVHTACRAILQGDCRAALAGGVNIMTSSEWFQNLAAASFLSPTGQCKPFDADADGYCRGEAVGAVFLKKLSAAIADGDPIFGVIAASAVYQNQDSTAITVPNAPSLSHLFHDVIRRSRIGPKAISYVEAHGTGTPVGDPIEYDSIRQVLGGDKGCGELSVGSVKGLLGHAEAASGIVALIKVLLMMHHQCVPPQASFQTLRPDMNARASDNMTIATELLPWRKGFKAALINNYGASGSNAALVVTQAPRNEEIRASRPVKLRKYPAALLALDEQGLKRYSSRLRAFLTSKLNNPPPAADIAYQLARRTNWSLPHSLVFSFSTTTELVEKLEAFENTTRPSPSSTKVPPPRPLILCFGGQVSSSIGLNKQLYEEVKILRKHLDTCNEICASLGTSIYPSIFQQTAVHDTVALQLALFSLQYSCAQTWLDSGAAPAAVVGHSFGELTALCVAGVLSLPDALTVVAGRAQLIRDHWGPEKGCMVAVRADRGAVERLLAESRLRCSSEEPAATIACFNAERSFTIAGTSKAIEAVLKVASSNTTFSSSITTKQLDVTHAFHCSLVDPIASGLGDLTRDITFHEARIPIELATERASSPPPDFIATHMRQPVYFHHAVQRLSQRYPSAVWLEAGSNSTITKMASRAVGPGRGLDNHFQSMNITASEDPFGNLTDATTSLWREGLNLTFWPHHISQAHEYGRVLLPPYQFKKSRHWLERTKPHNSGADPPSTTGPERLWSLLTSSPNSQQSCRFIINTDAEQYKNILHSHLLMQTYPLCPSTLQLSIVMDALTSLRAEYADGTMQPRLLGMQSDAPLSLNASRVTWFDVALADAGGHTWEWKICSSSRDETPSSSVVQHVSGTITFDASVSSEPLRKEFSQYESRAKGYRYRELLESWDADEILQGKGIYRSFADVVEYGDMFRGVQKLVGRGEAAGSTESAGRITPTRSSTSSWSDFAVADAFCQVAGIYINTSAPRNSSELYISDKITQWLRSPPPHPHSTPETWEVYARHQRPSGQEYVSDIFVFDPRDGALREVILGVRYRKVSKTRLGHAVAKANNVDAAHATKPTSKVVDQDHRMSNGTHTPLNSLPITTNTTTTNSTPSTDPTPTPITTKLKEIIANLSGLETAQISPSSALADLGIDSLMGMELAREIEGVFACTLASADLLTLSDFQSLVDLVLRTLGVAAGSHEQDGDGDGGLDSTEVVGPLTNGYTGHTTTKSNPAPPLTNGNENKTHLPTHLILETFAQSRELTDEYVLSHSLGGYVENVLPRLDELCSAYISDAFAQLGSPVSVDTGTPGERIPHLPRHRRYVDLLYDLVAKTSPPQAATTLLQDLHAAYPAHKHDYDLLALAGARLADCLAGKAEGLQILFGSASGRAAASAMYGHSPINVVWIRQLRDFLRSLVARLAPSVTEPLQVFEIGAGTGGTTANIVPVLAELGVPIRYTVSDISSSFVAALRKRFKKYDWVEYCVFDIETPVPSELLRSQHIVLATNCVHVAHDLVDAAGNIRRLLRPDDGFLIMLEMTQTLAWIDVVFGLLEGWWRFDDGREHALVPASVWKDVLLRAGYGHIEWTDGDLPESGIQRLILAMAAKPRYATDPPLQQSPRTETDHEALQARKTAVDTYVREYTAEIFTSPPREITTSSPPDAGPIARPSVVLITGATGSLGSHLAQCFAENPKVKTVICLNRRHSTSAEARQAQALETRGIRLEGLASRKLRVLQADTWRPQLGLSQSEYEDIARNVTHVVHNAWPMSITRSVHAYEAQFKTMRNLLVLARDAYEARPSSDRRPGKIAFQFISSIAVVGFDPLRTRKAVVPEERMPVEAALPNGYADAKLVCESMLDEALGQYPHAFRRMVVRLGQVSGSRVTGYWNPIEHFPAMVKSAQTLQALPDLQGVSWLPFLLTRLYMRVPYDEILA